MQADRGAHASRHSRNHQHRSAQSLPDCAWRNEQRRRLLTMARDTGLRGHRRCRAGAKVCRHRASGISRGRHSHGAVAAGGSRDGAALAAHHWHVRFAGGCWSPRSSAHTSKAFSTEERRRARWRRRRREALGGVRRSAERIRCAQLLRPLRETVRCIVRAARRRVSGRIRGERCGRDAGLSDSRRRHARTDSRSSLWRRDSTNRCSRSLLRGEHQYRGLILSDWAITRDCPETCVAPTGANKQQPRRPSQRRGASRSSVAMDRFAQRGECGAGSVRRHCGSGHARHGCTQRRSCRSRGWTSPSDAS